MNRGVQKDITRRRMTAGEIVISFTDKLTHQSHFQSESVERASNYNYTILRETWLIRLRRALSGLFKSINNSSLMSQRFH